MAESEWSKGVWLGPGNRNTETLIGTSKGVVRAHTVERLTPSTKWDINYILDMNGYPPETGSLEAWASYTGTDPAGT